MRGLGWTLIWLAILAGSGWYLWRRLRWLWGRSELLGDTLTEAEAVLASISEEPSAPADGAPERPAHVELAIFRKPAEVAAERDRLRETFHQERAARRLASRPGWARRVDSIDADHRKA